MPAHRQSTWPGSTVPSPEQFPATSELPNVYKKKKKTAKSPLLVRTLSILGHPLEHPLCQSVLVGRDAAPRLSLLLVELLVSIAAQRFPLLTFFPSGQCLCPGRPMLSATRSPETRDSSLFQFNAWEPIAVPYLSHLLKLTCVNNQHDHGPWLCPPDGERQEGRGERERLQVVNPHSACSAGCAWFDLQEAAVSQSFSSRPGKRRQVCWGPRLLPRPRTSSGAEAHSSEALPARVCW